MKLEDIPSRSKDDALTLLCLNLLGTGISRMVYTCTLNPKKWVVKVEYANIGGFQNVREHVVWDAVREVKAIAAWFAPVVSISDDGRFMVQERTDPLTLAYLKKNLPKVPACFTDLKVGNWGMLRGRVVCHDYGTCLTTEYGLRATLRKAQWWE